MLKRISFILILGGFLFTFYLPGVAQAGFGVSPPKVLNRNLLPGSHFEQTIYLVQSKPDKELLAQIEIDAPEIRDWISIDRGLEFTIPVGVQQFPIKISVTVPSDAEFKHYDGEMWVKTIPKDNEGGMVTVALGAIIGLDLTVSKEEVFGFVVRGVDVSNVEEGRPVKIGVSLENVGNVEDGPTKIHVDIYDQYHDRLLYSGDDVDLDKIEPFKTEKVVGKFKAKLSIGSYWADIVVYKGDKVLIEDKRVFYVIERTSILYKIFIHWYSWAVLGLVILVILVIVFRKKIKIFIKILREVRKNKLKLKLENKLKKLR